MKRVEQLSRTIALYQSDLGIPSDHIVEHALRRVNVLLVMGSSVSATLAGQSALLTAALLIARSGHQVYVQCDDAPLVGHQPPFEGASIHDSIYQLRGQLIDGSDIRLGTPDRIDIAFDLGTASSIPPVPETRRISVGWSKWSGEICDWPSQPQCIEFRWPMGAMAAAVLIAAEVAKIPARTLAALSPDPAMTRAVFGKSAQARLVLADESTPTLTCIGEFTGVSAGAVMNGFHYALARLPDVHGRMTIFDDDISDLSNLNRNMLLTRNFVGLPKVQLVDHYGHGLRAVPNARRFERRDLNNISGRAVTGVDHIPSRWLLAESGLDWIGIGATSHFNVLNSVHYPYSGCPGCLHPHDEAGPAITPTIAFVSFLSGLILAADTIIERVTGTVKTTSHQRYISPLRLNSEHADKLMGVPLRRDCPARCHASRLAA